MKMNKEANNLPMIQLTIDGNEISVPKGTTIYKAAKKLEIDIPIFCYHDRMPPFGACRMCLVEVEKMPKLQASCTLEVAEGMVVKTQSTSAVQGRKEVVEFLLINHPLDCPVCDRGGECPLQENTLKHGPGSSRFFEEKRHFEKPLPLGSVLMLDRERCIACARCTRFSEELSGDHALQLLDRGHRIEVGTTNQDFVDSKFIGNTIMICPVGALTSQVYRFRARPWDNEPTPTTCTLCPVGCSMILDSRDGQIMRTRSRENREVNDIWLCDKGWFGYEFAYHPQRLQTPLIRHQGQLIPASWEEALSLIAQKMLEAKSGGKLAAFGGNPLTIEENYLFQQLMREGLGVDHVDHRVGMDIFNEQEEGLPAGMEISPQECEELAFAIFFGLDLTEEFPVIWLRLRQAINRGSVIHFYGHFSPEIASYCDKIILHPPGQEHEIIEQASKEIVSLAGKGKGAIFVGRQYFAQMQRKSLLSRLLELKHSIPNCSLNILEGRGNSMGARFAGMRPDCGPSGEIKSQGFSIVEVLEQTARDGWDFLYVAGANPAMHYPSSLWKHARAGLKFMVVQDLFMNETAQGADVVLPSLSFIEKGGSFMTIEGRIQRIFPGKEIPDTLYSDGEIFTRLGKKIGLDLVITSDFMEKLQSQKPFKTLPMKIDTEKTTHNASSDHSHFLRATFTHLLFDHGVRMKHDPHLVWLAKEPAVRLHPIEGKRRLLQNEKKLCFTIEGHAIVAPVTFDQNVAEGTVVFPLGFEEKIPVREFAVHLWNGLPVEIQKEE
jgi:NADH-quinone oxidoreductase subunit G